MEKREADWRTILLVLGAAGGAVLACGGAALMVAFSSLDLARLEPANAGTPAISTAVLASALLMIGAIFVVGLYYGLLQWRGRPVPLARPRVLRVWQGIVLVLAWAGAAAGAGWLFDKPIAKWISPALYVLAIAIPAYFFLRLAMGGLQPGSRERLWGGLAAGIGLGITPAMVAELVVMLIGLVAVAIYIGLNPGQLSKFRELAGQLRNSNGLENLVNTISPWLNNPLALLLALFFFSGLSPLIEETAKSLATWTVFDRLTSPAQGFAIGAVSGAAFGLVESLLISSNPDSSWTTTLLVRGASTMMHIMAASLTGWGIGQFRLTHSFARLSGSYLAAMSLHGLWNASVVAITFGSLRGATLSNSVDPVGMIMMFMGGAVLLLLCAGIPLAMGSLNWRFRRQAADAALASMPAGQSMEPLLHTDAPPALENADRPEPEGDAKPLLPPLDE